MKRISELLEKGPVAVNIGIADFALSLREQGAEAVDVEWRPTLAQDPQLKRILDKIL